MKISKFFLAGTATVLAIAGAFATKSAKSNFSADGYTCTSGLDCKFSTHVFPVTTSTNIGNVKKNGANVTLRTCAQEHAACGATLYTRPSDII